MRLDTKNNGAAGYQGPVKIELGKGAGLLTFSCFFISNFRKSSWILPVLGVTVVLEWFPIECRKTKTKVVTLANRNRCKQHNEPIRIRSAKRGKTRAAKT